MKRYSGMRAPGRCDYCGGKQVFTSLHGELEVICARGCDDLPYGGATLPVIAIEGEINDVAEMLRNFPKQGG